MLLGRFWEARATCRTGDALRSLLDLTPPTALRLGEAGPTAVAIPLAQVQPGDRLQVLPGAALPADGVILSGVSLVSEALLTGESLPVQRGPGDLVVAGSVNGSGALVIRAERTGSDTRLAGIVGLVARAQSSKANIERFADRVSARFVPFVLGLALVSGGLWGSGGRISAGDPRPPGAESPA